MNISSQIENIIKYKSIDTVTNSDGYVRWETSTPIYILSAFVKGRNGTNTNGWFTSFSVRSDTPYTQWYFPVVSKDGANFGARDVTIQIAYVDMPTFS